MSTHHSLLAVPLIALALAGCGGVSVYDSEYGGRTYDAADLDYAHRKGAIEAVVAGDPFGGDQAAFGTRVRALMKGQNRGQPADFVAAQGPRTDPLYKTVVVFDPVPGIGADEMCRKAGKVPTRPASDELHMSIAFCEGDTARSAAEGYAQKVAGPDDPAFARLVRETTEVMVPDYNYLERHQGRHNEAPPEKG